MSLPVHQSHLDSIKDLVRSGQFLSAQKLMGRIPVTELSREQRLQLAFLANSARLPKFALHLLRKLVRPETFAENRKATAEERLEYVTALNYLGLHDEAIELLHSLGKESRIPARFYHVFAFTHFQRWDWESALPLLERAMELPKVNLSDRLITKMWFGSALLHGKGDHERARSVLLSVLDEGRAKSVYQVTWDSAQLLAQSYYLCGEWKESRHYLDLAERFFGGDSRQVPAMAIMGFRALIDLNFQQEKTKAIRQLNSIQAELFEKRAWERVRSFDYYRAIALQDVDLLARLYYGTPIPLFRARLLKAFGAEESSIPDLHELTLGKRRGLPKGWLEVSDAENSFGRNTLKAGQLPQRLLAALCSDFYSLRSVAQLHAVLHPGEFYSPDASSDKVWHSLGRLRSFLRGEKIPLSIVVENGLLRLQPHAPLVIRIRRGGGAARQRSIRLASQTLEVLFRKFGQSEFRAREVEELLGVSRATAVAAIQAALDSGFVSIIGNGPSTRYFILKEPAS